MFKVLLWDIDGTVLDFKAAESFGMKAAFEELGLPECTDELIAIYSSINQKYWERLERGEITKNQVLIGRFEEFLASEGIDVSPELMCTTYESHLSDNIVPIDNSLELLRELAPFYKQYAVTNGAYVVQRNKLDKAGISAILDGDFISDEVGYEKPSIYYFNHVLDNIERVDLDEILIIGDSLTSDILGGNNAGIKTCWYNPKHNAVNKDVSIDYEIDDLNKIKDILGV